MAEILRHSMRSKDDPAFAAEKEQARAEIIDYIKTAEDYIVALRTPAINDDGDFDIIIAQSTNPAQAINWLNVLDDCKRQVLAGMLQAAVEDIREMSDTDIQDMLRRALGEESDD